MAPVPPWPGDPGRWPYARYPPGISGCPRDSRSQSRIESNRQTAIGPPPKTCGVRRRRGLLGLGGRVMSRAISRGDGEKYRRSPARDLRLRNPVRASRWGRLGISERLNRANILDMRVPENNYARYTIPQVPILFQPLATLASLSILFCCIHIARPLSTNFPNRKPFRTSFSDTTIIIVSPFFIVP